MRYIVYEYTYGGKVYRGKRPYSPGPILQQARDALDLPHGLEIAKPIAPGTVDIIDRGRIVGWATVTTG